LTAEGKIDYDDNSDTITYHYGNGKTLMFNPADLDSTSVKEFLAVTRLEGLLGEEDDKTIEIKED